MKKILIVALMIAGSSAFATKARYNALGGAAHLTDVQIIFAIPSDMMLLPESMEFNFGTKYNAEGGMIKNHGDAKLGFFVGNQQEDRTTTYLDIDNPFTVLYGAKAGDMNWGVAFTYSSSTKKAGSAASTDDQSQSYMTLNGSVAMGDTTVALDLGLADKAKGDGTTDSNEISNTPMTLAVYHKISDWTAYFSYMSNVNKVDTGTEAKTTTSDMMVGAVHAMKSEGADFFYGFALDMKNQKDPNGDKTSEMYMPFILGIEADAASWLTLRGSVTQNVLLSSKKVTGTTPSGADTADHNTMVNAGLGFKFTKSVLDITLSATDMAATTPTPGKIDGTSFGAHAGLTYLF